MVSVTVQREYDFPAETVWAVLEDFGDISWAPGMDNVIVEGEGVGMVRKIIMGDADPVIERLESIDPRAMTLSYSIPQGIPMPVSDYKASPQVVALDGNRCRIDWSCTAKAEGVSDEEASNIIKGFYEMLLQWFQDHLAK